MYHDFVNVSKLFNVRDSVLYGSLLVVNVCVPLVLYILWTCSFAGALRLEFGITELEAVKSLQIVCQKDGREMHSAEQLKEHLAMGHKEMWLLREDFNLSPFALAVNVDRISPIISKLTTGDLEENLMVWVKDEELCQYLDVSQSTVNQVAGPWK